jgi:hypothetical protein
VLSDDSILEIVGISSHVSVCSLFSDFSFVDFSLVPGPDGFDRWLLNHVLGITSFPVGLGGEPVYMEVRRSVHFLG